MLFYLILKIYLKILGVYFYWLGFKYKVKIYEPISNLTKEEILNIKGMTEEQQAEYIEAKRVIFSSMNFKKTKGKFIKRKGAVQFSLFMPFKRIQNISSEFIYEDGIHLLKLSMDCYLPIKKPKFFCVANKDTLYDLVSENKWDIMDVKINREIEERYKDPDKEKRITLIIIVGIVAMVIVGGLLLWFITMAGNKNADLLAQGVTLLKNTGALNNVAATNIPA